MKSEILSLEKVYDQTAFAFKWVANIEFEDNPKLTLGECEVTQ